jgi:hypothetical protein
MRRAEGHYEIIDPTLSGGKAESDTIQCAHCNGHFDVIPYRDPVSDHGICLCCLHFICEGCADEMDRTLKCVPFERRLERLEAQDRFRRSVGV